jgi:hypothetical protein
VASDLRGCAARSRRITVLLTGYVRGRPRRLPTRLFYHVNAFGLADRRADRRARYRHGAARQSTSGHSIAAFVVGAGAWAATGIADIQAAIVRNTFVRPDMFSLLRNVPIQPRCRRRLHRAPPRRIRFTWPTSARPSGSCSSRGQEARKGPTSPPQRFPRSERRATRSVASSPSWPVSFSRCASARASGH